MPDKFYTDKKKRVHSINKYAASISTVKMIKSEGRGFYCQCFSGTLIFRFDPAAWNVTYSSQKMEKLFQFSAEL
jgi:hypothetical protein